MTSVTGRAGVGGRDGRSKPVDEEMTVLDYVIQLI